MRRWHLVATAALVCTRRSKNITVLNGCGFVTVRSQVAAPTAPSSAQMLGRHLALGTVLVTAAVGCGDDVPDFTADGTSGALPPGQVDSTGAVDADGPDAGDDTPTGNEPTSGVDPTTGDTGFEPPEPACGNGFIEDDEQCDDGNRDDADGCNNACQVPCGLDFATLALPPTDESVVTADHVVATADGGAVLVGLLREITTDQRGNEQIEPDVAQAMHFDAAGRVVWTTNVDNPDGGLSPEAVAVDGDGNIVIAATGDDPDGTDGIFVVKLAVADGEELWRHTFAGDIADEDDAATGVAVTAQGDVVVSGQARVGEGDNDVWVRRLAAADGTEVWTSTYSGAGTGMFSTDDGGPVTVDADGQVWVLGLEYVDFETRPPVLLRFAADGGPAELVQQQSLPGTEQQYDTVDIVAADGGGVFVAYLRVLGSGLQHVVARHAADGTQTWLRSGEDFETDAGSDWDVAGIAVLDGELLVAGSLTNDVTIPDAEWSEVWVARVADDSTTRCQAIYRGQADGLLPPSIDAAAAAAGSVDSIGLVSGLQFLDGDTSLWLGRFRPE